MLRSGPELFSQNYSFWLSWVEEKETNSWNTSQLSWVEEKETNSWYTSQSHLFLIGKIHIIYLSEKNNK